MSYTPSNIVQSNEYYPFGLQHATSWTRDNAVGNNFLYDAGSEQNTTTAMYDLPNRNYDAALGRFFQVDQLSPATHDMTPYHYAANNPIGNNDPTGLMHVSEANVYNPETTGGGGHFNSFDEGLDAINDWNEAAADWSKQYEIEQTESGVMLTGDYARQTFATLMGGGEVGINVQEDEVTSISFGNKELGSLIIAFFNTPASFNSTGWGGVANVRKLSGALDAIDEFKSSGAKLNNLVLFSHGSPFGDEIHFGDVYDDGDNLTRDDYLSGSSPVRATFNLILDEVASGGNVVLLGCNAGKAGGIGEVMQTDLRCDINVFVSEQVNRGVGKAIPSTFPTQYEWQYFNMSPKALNSNPNTWINLTTGQRGLNMAINPNGTVTVLGPK